MRQPAPPTCNSAGTTVISSSWHNPPMRQPVPILAVGSTRVLPTYSGPLPSTLLLWMRRLS
eukprot:scaffold190470_cov14-Tisochrysis_lutea.AAC.1